MSAAWHRSEPREVRPFFETVAAEDALALTGLRLFGDGDTLPDASFELDEVDFAKLRPSMRVDLASPSLWMPPGLADDDLEVAVIARQSFVKRSEVVARLPIGGTFPVDVEISPETLEAFAGGRNLRLTAVLALAADREPRPGAPFVQGHWLASKEFLLRARSLPALFDVRVRSDGEWSAAGYPPKTLYAVEYAGGIAGEMEDGGSVATVYVHVDAHAKMAGGTIGDSLQPLLAAEIVTSIVVAGAEEWKDADAIHPASPLATLLKQMSRDGEVGLDDLRRLVAEPSRLRAELQQRLGVVRAL